jgi:hypothetical protein
MRVEWQQDFSGMQPRPSFNRSLLIPILRSLVLLLGLGWLLSACDPARPSIPATASPSSLRSLETETPAPTPYIRDESARAATATSPDAYPAPFAGALPLTTTTVTETLPPPSATPTPETIQPLRGGKYDDVDPNIAYDPYWMALKNASTASSFRGTIHASSNVGSEASFRFTGKRFSLGYKRGKSFGTVTVIVDGQEYNFNEEAFDLVWHSPTLSPGDHFVQMIHQSGEAVNLDYIVIVE